MKNYNKSKLAGFLLLFSIILVSNSSNPPNGRTGAPGDGTCAGSCHSGTNSALDGEIDIAGLPATIDANTTYTITVTVDNPNGNGTKGGFQWVALDQSNINAGTMANAGSNTSITMAGGRTYHEHQPAQNFNSSNEVSYTVDWTAPSGPDGEDITIWASGVIANGAGGNSGDRVVFNTSVGTLSAAATPPTATIISQSDVSCNGLDDGSATVEATGGSPGYDYLWDDSQNQTTATADDLEAGSYTVTVTDSNNETATAMVTIGEPATIDITVIANTPEMCGNMNGYLEVSATGGSGTYSFDWSNGGTGNFQDNLDSGSYTVTVTDGNNCSETLSLTVGIDNGIAGAQPVIIINPTCAGGMNGYIEVMGTNGMAPYTFLWSNGGTGPIINSLSAGTYAVTATDANNCMGINVFTLTEPDFSITTDSTDIVCPGDADGMAFVSVNGGFGNPSYLWSNGATTDNIINLIGGTYYVTVTDENNCTLIDSTIVNEPAALLANLTTTPETAGMMNGTATANPSGGTPGYSVDWSNGMTGLMISNLSLGTYTATVTDTLGCVTIDSIFVTSSDCGLAVSFTQTDISCFGDENGAIDLSSTNVIGNVSYNWSNGAMTEDLSGLESGYYSVTVSDDMMCQVLIDSIEITEPDSFFITPNIIVQPGCQGQNFGTISANINGGTGPYSYQWAIGFTTDTINVLTGFYPVTVTDGNNCTSSTLVNLNGIDDTPPTMMVTDFTLYLDETGFTSTIDSTLFDLGNFDDCDVQGYVFNEGPLDCTVLGLSDFPIALEDVNGNFAYDTVTVTVIDTFAPDIFCIDDMTISECDGWTFTQPLTFDNCGASLTQTLGPVAGDILPLGVTEFAYEAIDSSGNTSTCSFFVTVENGLMADVSLTDVSCFGFSDGMADFSIAGGTAPYEVEITNISDPTQLDAGTYFYTIIDESGCEIQDSFIINEPDALFISDSSVTNSTNSNSMDGSIDITVTGGVGNYTYEWFLNGVVVSTDEDPTGLAPGVYTCVVMDENGCIYTSLDLTVEATTSSNEVAILTDLKVYPNPASEELTINLSSEEFHLNRINLVSLDGKNIITKNVKTNNLNINVTDVSSGVYLLQLILADDIVYKKIVIE